jgi:hypothetical protein
MLLHYKLKITLEILVLRQGFQALPLKIALHYIKYTV